MLPWREAVRAIVVDPDDRVLLVHFDFGVWAPPGGGLQHDETHEQALRRELAEELGLDDVELGPWMWSREHAFDTMPGYCGQRERIYLVRTARFEPRPRTDLGAEHVIDLRWWASTSW
jgi:ADP-ribose pyrophosphatase YjhB (NUDIX family)